MQGAVQGAVQTAVAKSGKGGVPHAVQGALHIVVQSAVAKSGNFFSVRRLLAFARSFNTFDCMLQR